MPTGRRRLDACSARGGPALPAFPSRGWRRCVDQRAGTDGGPSARRRHLVRCWGRSRRGSSALARFGDSGDWLGAGRAGVIFPRLGIFSRVSTGQRQTPLDENYGVLRLSGAANRYFLVRNITRSARNRRCNLLRDGQIREKDTLVMVYRRHSDHLPQRERY
jgi:hypothetical protein